RLREAGVVDAGARGLTVVLDAAEHAPTGTLRSFRKAVRKATAEAVREDKRRRRQRAKGEPEVHPGGDLTAEGPAYEVMFLLDADAAAMAPLRAALAPLGDSLVVTGRDGLWHVHVHVDDVGAAIEAGIAAGRPHRIRVTHFAQQIEQAEQAGARRARAGRAVIAVAAGKGLERLFADAGAVVLRSSVSKRPSVGRLVKTIERTGAAEVVLLPNDTATLEAARAAALRIPRSDIRVEVVPSQAQVQGLAAMAVHDPERPFERAVLEMTAAASHARHGAVTLATHRAIMSAGRCEEGDALGAVDGDFLVIGTELDRVTTDVLRRLLGGGGELVTIVAGSDKGARELAEEAGAWVERTYPAVEVVTYDGGQGRYPLLIGVE
ncbi:MAG: Dak phosphatase, partial [Nocardioides sp.]|uniref:Dak phosphatase n=1 Tax=Nocardioides sp. TaxID=35761 RepID=UPI0039E40991